VCRVRVWVRVRKRKIIEVKDFTGGFIQNPVTAYDPDYGHWQSSHMLRWPYPGEFSQFRPAVKKVVKKLRIKTKKQTEVASGLH